MDSTASVPSLSSDEEAKIFKELHGIFDKLFKWLLAIIAFKNTSMGEALFTAHPKLINSGVLAIVLHFLGWLLGTTLQSHVRNFLPILTCIEVLLASAASISALLLISPLIAWLSFPLWVAVFAVIAHYCYQHLYKMTLSAVSETVKKLIESYRAANSFNTSPAYSSSGMQFTL
ncbi:hypothetical protein L6164_022527 [Bauhinia variegata]|uniref:Uncharacterized protein n=1 Tax=Bauhinia variegata TaxID=167791 RepID=A0ACB9MGE2_BAUVA|nr:hypothetical protein L6164_022527 [Bauhinia variegata]